MLKDAIARAERSIGPYHPVTVELVHRITESLNAQNRMNEALIMTASFMTPPSPGLSLRTFGGLLELVRRQIVFPGSVRRRRTTAGGLSATAGARGLDRMDIGKYRWTVAALADICIRLGKPDEAKKWQARVEAARAATQAVPPPSQSP